MADCATVRDQAAELALGILPAEERAVALSHVEECRECRSYVHDLTLVGEELLTVLPAAEPPAGFENKVLDSLVRPVRRTRKRKLVATAVAATAWIAAWLTGAIVGFPVGSHDSAAPSSEAVIEAEFTSTGQPVGHAYVYADEPTWTYMDMNQTGGQTGLVRCELVLRNGQTIEIGTFRVASGRGHWGSPVPVAAADLSSIRLVGTDGTVIAAASFG
jgi:hypothetical protein